MTNTATLPETSTATWNIDPTHSIAEFKVKHMMIANVKGQFSKVSGALFRYGASKCDCGERRMRFI